MVCSICSNTAEAYRWQPSDPCRSRGTPPRFRGLLSHRLQLWKISSVGQILGINKIPWRKQHLVHLDVWVFRLSNRISSASEAASKGHVTQSSVTIGPGRLGGFSGGGDTDPRRPEWVNDGQCGPGLTRCKVELWSKASRTSPTAKNQPRSKATGQL